MSDIKSICDTKEEYPNPEKLKSIDTNSDFVPDSLQSFLKQIINHRNLEKRLYQLHRQLFKLACQEALLNLFRSV